LQWLEGDGRASSGEHTGNGVWARGIHRSSEADDGDAIGSITGAEVGYDFKILNSHRNKIYLGFMGYIASGDFEFGGQDSSNLNAFGVGVYGIWLGQNGWFADAAVRQHFISQDVAVQGAGISGATTFDSSHTATSINIDFGRQFVFGQGNRVSWFLTPHAQFSAAQIGGSDFAMSNGLNGQIEDMMNAELAFVLRGGPRWTMQSGAKIQLYAKGGYIEDFSDDAAMRFDGANFQRNLGVANYEFGGGLNFRSADKRTTAHLDVQQRIGEGFSELSGVLGIRRGF